MEKFSFEILCSIIYHFIENLDSPANVNDANSWQETSVSHHIIHPATSGFKSGLPRKSSKISATLSVTPTSPTPPPLGLDANTEDVLRTLKLLTPHPSSPFIVVISLLILTIETDKSLTELLWPCFKFTAGIKINRKTKLVVVVVSRRYWRSILHPLLLPLCPWQQFAPWHLPHFKWRDFLDCYHFFTIYTIQMLGRLIVCNNFTTAFAQCQWLISTLQ